MESIDEKLLTLKEASKMTPYSSDYLGLLVRKGRIGGYKKDGKWFTTEKDVESYMKRTAESSYEHQQSLNVKIPAQEIKEAANNFRWAVILLSVVIISLVYVWKTIDGKKNESASGKYQLIEDEENNLLIYVDDPGRIKSVKVMSK